MILTVLVIVILIVSQNIVIGYKTVYEYTEDGIVVCDPTVNDFKSLDDAMEYAELRKTGWHGSVSEFYKWKEEE